MGFVQRRMVWRVVIAGAVLIQTELAFAAGIVASGGTATTVTTAAGGRQTVNIAPAVSGVSHNTYTEFNVGSAGAQLNNVGVNARNIVNQVTGSNPSLIEGDITVLGPRANVILANPNGVTVNGGSFINTGNVAITTGSVTFNDILISPGNTQRNIVLNTSQGSIIIRPGGLSGTILDLALIAKNVSVNGAVLNTVSNSSAKIQVVAGDSHAEIDGSVSPTDLTSTWIGYTSPGTVNAGATALDITPFGSLTAGRIELIVTDQGAGVQQAGAILANVGDFTISGNGDLHVNGGRIAAVGDVIVNTATLSSRSADNIAPAITAGGTVDIGSGTVTLADIAINAGQRTIDAGGNSVVTQVGNILMGTDGVAGTGVYSFNNSVFNATGGIGLFDNTRQIQIGASRLSAEQNIIVKSRDVFLFANWAQRATAQSSLTSNTGSVAITATDALQMNGALIAGIAGVNINANTFSATASHNPADANTTIKSSLQSAVGSIAFNVADALNLVGSDVFAAQDVVSQSNAFSSINDGALASSVIASNGGVLIGSASDIDNVGSLIQGSVRIAGNAASLGAVTLNATGNILNRSPSENMLGAIFGVDDDVVLQASADIMNRNARIISNKALSLTAGGDVQNVIDQQASANGGQAVSYQTTDSRWLFLSERSSGFDVDYGQVPMPDQQAYLVADSGMTIHATNFINAGGNVLVNNGNIAITASNTFHNEAVFAGQAHYRSSCLIFCSAAASSNVTSYGGSLNASGDIAIQAGTQAANIGGNVLALGNLTVTAPSIYASGVAGYRAYTQDGLKTWFGSSWGRLYATDTGGSWLAGNTLTLNGQGIIEGGSFTGLMELVAANGILTLRAPQSQSVSIERHLGLFGGL